MRRQEKEITINHMSLLNISGRTHILSEKQRNEDTGIREKGRNSSLILQCWIFV